MSSWDNNGCFETLLLSIGVKVTWGEEEGPRYVFPVYRIDNHGEIIADDVHFLSPLLLRAPLDELIRAVR